MKKILITGGAGFLGSHLSERLWNEGNDIVCLDNFFTGQERNIQHLVGKPRFQVIRHDVIDPIEPVLKTKVDQIYNLACPASPVHYQHDPIFTMKTSVFGALNVLEYAKKHGTKVFQASTSEVYGDPEVHPQPESYWGRVNPIGIRSCYDEGKRAAETLFFDYHRFHGVDAKVVRIFNTYGPRMHPEDGRVVSNFIVQALRKQPLTIYGEGKQTRSFCYYEDLIDGFIRMMGDPDRDWTGPVNLGNPGEFTMLELAEKVLKLTGSSSKLEFRPLPKDDPTQRRPEISVAKQKLGWEPKIALDQGLKRTIEYFDSVLKENA